jgi:hypothetical protein
MYQLAADQVIHRSKGDAVGRLTLDAGRLDPDPEPMHPDLLPVVSRH